MDNFFEDENVLDNEYVEQIVMALEEISLGGNSTFFVPKKDVGDLMPFDLVQNNIGDIEYQRPHLLISILTELFKTLKQYNNEKHVGLKEIKELIYNKLHPEQTFWEK